MGRLKDLISKLRSEGGVGKEISLEDDILGPGRKGVINQSSSFVEGKTPIILEEKVNTETLVDTTLEHTIEVPPKPYLPSFINLAEAICYADSVGLSAKAIIGYIQCDEEYVEEVIRLSRETGIYDELVTKAKPHLQGVFQID